MMTTYHAGMMTAVGPIVVSASTDRLVSIRIGAPLPDPATPTALLHTALDQLKAWFEGRLTIFDLPLAPSPTPRGPAHRDAILGIPFGTTASYGMLARELGSSPRAVGQACRSNPFPIVVPCHRVLAQGGLIGHYTGGEGVITKRWLLAHEQAQARPN